MNYRAQRKLEYWLTSSEDDSEVPGRITHALKHLSVMFYAARVEVQMCYNCEVYGPYLNEQLSISLGKLVPHRVHDLFLSVSV